MNNAESIPVEPAHVELSWSGIERLTRDIRRAASDRNWTEVVDLAARRHHDLVRHFEAFPVGPDNAGFYQQHLGNMLKGEQELQNLAVDARRQLMREGLALRQTRKAMGAYMQGSRG